MGSLQLGDGEQKVDGGSGPLSVKELTGRARGISERAL